MNALLLILSLLFFLAIRIPVVFSLFLSCFFYIVFVRDFPLIILAHRALGSIENFMLIALPLYILAADLINSGKVTDEMFKFARSLVGHVRGSMAHVNVVASIIFAGMSGSITADTAGLGRIEIPLMEKAGFSKKFAVSITGASSIIGPICPPSIQMILYGMIAEQSVGRLFIGGAIPGLLMGLSLMVGIYIVAIKKNLPRDPSRAPLKVIVSSFKKSFLALMTPVIILGGIISGVFTPTEAAVVAVIYTFMVSYFIYKTINLKMIIPMAVNAAMTSAMILVITAAASVFGWLVTMENIPQLIQQTISTATDQQWVVLLILNIMFFTAGMFFDIAAILLVLTPMIIPVLQAFHIDMVHWGVVEVLNVCIGFLTPPFGVGLFILADLSGLSVSEVTKGMLPWLIPLIVVLLAITYIPGLVLWLPNLIFG